MAINFESVLFVPCELPKLEKSQGMKADWYIFDLEDSIRDKADARQRLYHWLAQNKPASNWVVRVNKANLAKEVEELYGQGIRTIMLPKAEDKAVLEQLYERYQDLRLWLLIETAKGMFHAPKLCEYGNVSAIAFGAEDYCSDTGMISSEELLLPLKTRLVYVARAFGKKIFDTVTLELKDEDIIKESINRSVSLGFDGKLLIHPKQVEVLDSIDDKDQELFKTIIQLYDESNLGIIKYNGRIYEKPHIEYMRRRLYGRKE